MISLIDCLIDRLIDWLIEFDSVDWLEKASFFAVWVNEPNVDLKVREIQISLELEGPKLLSC